MFAASKPSGYSGALHLLLVAMAMTVAGPSTSAALAQENRVQEGEKLYEEACAACHGRRGELTARGQAKRLNAVTETEFRGYLLSKRALETPVRPYERLKKALIDDEIDALAAYTARFRQP